MVLSTGYASLGPDRIYYQVLGEGPIDLVVNTGGWGSIEQTVMEESGKLKFTRRIVLDSARIDAGDFAVIREALNTFRSDGARRILIGLGAD